MLTKIEMLAVVGFIVLGVLAFVLLGNYYLAIAAIVGLLGTGLVAIIRNRTQAGRGVRQ